MEESMIVHALAKQGFVVTGEPGWPSEFTRESTSESFKVPRSIRMQREGLDASGSRYIHHPGVIVATGVYRTWFESLRAPNGRMKEYPAWRDFRGEKAVTDLLSAIAATD